MRLTGRRFVRFFFFFNDTATTEIYTLSLHDALPILVPRQVIRELHLRPGLLLRGIPRGRMLNRIDTIEDRKSTRLNSSHANISYAVFCLKKKKKTHQRHPITSTSHLIQLTHQPPTYT